ncbi:hypothetical protein OSTOST_23337, partial [Ostertagia ostertagi]
LARTPNNLLYSSARLLERFWDSWHKEYLQSLAEKCQKTTAPKQGAASPPKVGDVVLVKDENASRTNWPLGLITEIISSADGSPRSVKLKVGTDSLAEKKKQESQPTRIQPQRKTKPQRRI